MKKLHLHFSSVLTLLILTLICQSNRVLASQSDLDPTFGIGGKTIWSPNNSTESRGGVGMVVQPDGKIVMVGIVLLGVVGVTMLALEAHAPWLQPVNQFVNEYFLKYFPRAS